MTTFHLDFQNIEIVYRSLVLLLRISNILGIWVRNPSSSGCIVNKQARGSTQPPPAHPRLAVAEYADTPLPALLLVHIASSCFSPALYLLPQIISTEEVKFI